MSAFPIAVFVHSLRETMRVLRAALPRADEAEDLPSTPRPNRPALLHPAGGPNHASE